MLFFTKNLTPHPADSTLNYFISHKKYNSSSSWSSNKLLFSTKSLTPLPADPSISYVTVHKKSKSSTSQSYDKLCYFPQKIQLLFKLILEKTIFFLTKNPTLCPADPPINYVVFHKISSSSSSWFSKKVYHFSQKIELLLQLILQETMWFFTKNLTSRPADLLLNYVIFYKKSKFLSNWSTQKLCYLIFHKKFSSSSSWSFNKRLFSTKPVTPAPADSPINCYFPQKV